MNNIVNYISNAIIPIIIGSIIMYGVRERRKVFDDFLDGAKDGTKVVFNIFPTLIGIFVAVGVLRSSGILDLLINLINPITNFLKIPSEIMPLAILRPISGGASMAVALDILNQNGVDSRIGLIAATIMGSTETTVYTIAVYTSAVGIKKNRGVIWAALLADVTGIVTSVIFWNILFGR
ncbi:MAG: nucleoside recognition domain-containing protein [Clostridia bacterium]|nr:nucleoside recognition domain-containing protein [Clostridia bacterium]